MSQQRHSDNRLSGSGENKGLIADLDRIVQILNYAIKAEEKLVGEV
jgi:hypothetical protein